MFHVHLKRVCILVLSRMLYKWQVYQVDSETQIVCILVFCLLVVLSVIEKGVLKPPAVIVNFSISLCRSISFILHVFKALFTACINI